MTEPKFTPGPWNADGVYVCDENDAEVALCDGDNWEPNSYLIAAAPELYEALENLIKYTTIFAGHLEDSGYTTMEPVLNIATYKAKAALAKARGESHD